MKRTESENFSSVAYNIILDRIVKFNLSPGASVSDFVLSKELGISRTPVREALVKLVEDGLVVRKQHGFEVAKITSEDIEDLYDAREGVEVAMLRLAMKKGISPKKLSEIREINALLSQCIEQNDIIKAREYDSKLHEELASCSKNQGLLSFYNRISKQTLRMSVFSIAQSNQYASEEHEKIFQNIEKNDIAGAAEALSTNIRNAKEQNINVLKNSLRDGWMGIAKFIYQNSSSK